MYRIFKKPKNQEILAKNSEEAEAHIADTKV
jgi:hypothetical protein